MPYPASMHLEGVSEEGSIVTEFPLGELLLLSVFSGLLGVDTIAAGVLVSEVHVHEDREDQRHDDEAKEDTVTAVVVRSILGKVDETGDDTTEIAEADVHSNTDTTLDGATNVVTVPGDTLRDVGVDTRGKEESTGILGTVVLSGNEKDKTDDRDDIKAHHVDTTLLVHIGDDTTSDAESTGNDVRRNGHKLSALIGVSERLDNGRKEERVGVERSVDTNGDNTVDPDLPVLDGIPEVLEVKLIGKGAAILLKAADNLVLLLRGKEISGIRIIVHDPESSNGSDKGSKTLEDEEPRPARKVTNTVHLKDTTSKETTESTSSSSS